MSRKVFILGNGFDLDLHFKTKYSDYFEIWERNRLWPFDDSSKGLGGYLHRCAKTEKWLDLEMSLFNYASKEKGVATRGDNGLYPIESDKNDFLRLVNNLTGFITRIPNETSINIESVASKVLNSVLCSSEYSIYSFNYTNLNEIADRLQIKYCLDENNEHDINYTHVHGNIRDKSIILGVHSDACLIDGYAFLKKNYQPLYKATDIMQDLAIADEVVFFGLSMGIIDFPYFRNFFSSLSSGIIPKDKKKHITLFTLNESSRLELHEQLATLTGTDLMMLKNNSYFEIIRTSLCGSDDRVIFEKWIARQQTS